MKFILSAIILILISLTPAARAGDILGEIRIPDQTTGQNPLPLSWKWSLTPLLASQGLDVASSYGMRELNPILAGPRGQFGVSSVLVKAGVMGALIGVEYLIVKAHPAAARAFTKINWAGAAVTTGVAAHNFSIR
jgi:hypothetical protein